MAKAKQAQEKDQSQQRSKGATQGRTEQQQSQQTQQGGQAQGQRSAGLERRGRQGGGQMARRGVPGMFAMSPFQLMRMSPFQMMQTFAEEMDRMFEDFGGGALQQRGGQGLFGGAGFAPHVEVFQREGNLVVRADLPGLLPEDVNVEVTDDGLLIEGERRSEQSGEEGGLYHSEFSYGSFSRFVPLPEGVDAENARADFNNGVLEITMKAPQQQQQQRRRIEVRGGGQQQQAAGETTAHTKSRGKGA